jgi:hypothetical protein
MQRGQHLLFLGHALFALATVGLLAIGLVAAELKITRGPLFAELEIENALLLAQESAR